ncbi:MAG: hypothetical protein A2Y55_00430 [Actinobacteria bacterium RBG_16_68_12]|nr:MAG: hypothetical protein A2Y55_00430 [Actinobacteria bacterium RBG_16_68_12]
MLDHEDRVVQVGPDLQDQMAPFLGHVLWEHIPDAEPLYGPGFAEARRIGRPVEFPVFYRGRAKQLRAVPTGDTIAVHVERLAELDVRSLGTLAASLRRIEAELAAREPAPLDLRAHGSPQALP